MKDDHCSYMHNFYSWEKKAWKKFRLVRDSNPLTSAILVHRYRRGQGNESRTSRNFFSGFFFATAKVVYITAIIILHSSVFVLLLLLSCFVCLFVCFFYWNRNVLGFYVIKESEPHCKTPHRNFNSLSDETHGKSELTVHKQSRGYKRIKKRKVRSSAGGRK